MTTAKEKAEAYVRQALPELMELSFGCEVIAVMAKGDPTRVHATVVDKHEWKGWVCVHNYALGVEQTHPDNVKEIIGHPIQLQHWLRMLEGESFRTLTQREEHYKGKVVPDGHLLVWHETGTQVYFNLTTGQPDTEADYQAFNDIVGI